MALSALTAPILAVAVVALVSFASIRLYAWRAAKDPPKTAMRRIRTALAVGLSLTGLVALFALVLADALDLTESALGALSPALADSAVGAVLTWVPTFLGVTVAVVAGYLGAYPYVREIRGLDVSAASAAGSVAKLLGAAFALLVVVVGTLNLLPAGALDTALPVVGVLAALGVVLSALQPRILGLLNDVREPTDEERDRIVGLCETAGVSPHRVGVLRLDANSVATVVFAGLPGRRHLLVTEDLLADLDDDAAAAVLASKAGRAKYYYRETKFGVVMAVSALIIAVLTGELQRATHLGSGPLALAILVLAVALPWFGRRLVFAADDYAVERVGAETYVETLETLADEYQVSYESGRLRTLVLMRPSLGRRLDRLWGRTDE
ncbi:hypothetical protein [Halorussus sp. MSC15.2]|uniref:hypothetical protein n=1 Tax=Halorussus sp. MSC15.2 TaxID=2283638 RepID=UPI0013D6CC5E|nr:hypothetical protein [Halorussus sp. MSC15.2]NEU55458.1 hypothetical protein [Halorussus sp. MSC15.2]